ncbi:putative bifunctional diguanylate cyclase/phosphodiesterase [Yoonia sp. R2331]|uniref:putative bifunctional diguanylate cyclase/phosphodiesterase n=1 Tax=Yoonia sp. R2331 TaxID=3237238 RepID=UPI0034E5F6B5
MTDQIEPLGNLDVPRRRLSVVLLKRTLLIAFILGTAAAVLQLLMDFSQQKRAVELVAEDYLVSLAPSAASAAYNYHDEAAEQVVDGLFTLNAVRRVEIINDGAIMVSEERIVEPTLPGLGWVTAPDPITLSRVLVLPEETGSDTPFGKISIEVDRAIVSPAIVSRMLSYFLLSMAKNVVFGLVIAGLVFGIMAHYILKLADAAARWQPGKGAINVPDAPTMLQGTEVEVLSGRIQRMSEGAELAIDLVEKDNSVLTEQSDALLRAVEERTERLKKKSEELRRANQRLVRLAEHDALTGLNNRGAFDRKAVESYARSSAAPEPVAILLIDVDEFKAYNDFYGHQAGDACLTRVAQAIDRVAATDTRICARYGGEEFVIMLTGASVEACEAYAVALHDSVRSEQIPHQRAAHANHLTVSIGLSWEVPDDTTTLEALLSDADEALYEAKRRGRNQTVFVTGRIRAEAKDRRARKDMLLQALERREFEPVFQPQYDLSTGRLYGAEALVRWRTPDGRIEAPGSFMAEAEGMNIMEMIDLIMLEKCGDFLSELAAKGLHLPHLSVNATAQDLLGDAYVPYVIEMARRSDTALSVELVESALIDGFDDTALAKLDAMRSAGVSIEIDDFGTGQTSVLGLRVAQPDRLKIAQELIAPISDDPAALALVRYMVDTARVLGIGTIAEGVETEQQSRLLQDMDCTLHQGYFYAKPMPKSDFLTLLRSSDAGLHKAAS